jgi:hypothetical protein
VIVVVDVVSFFTSGGGAVVVVVVSVTGAGVVVVVVVSVTRGWGVVVVVVESVCFTSGPAGVTVVSVLWVTWAGGTDAGSCDVVVVVLGAWAAGGFCVVVEELDCVVLWAITGRDSASTMSEPRTTANSFLDVIRSSCITLVRHYGRAAATT